MGSNKTWIDLQNDTQLVEITFTQDQASRIYGLARINTTRRYAHSAARAQQRIAAIVSAMVRRDLGIEP